jgi:hypothetical protein
MANSIHVMTYLEKYVERASRAFPALCSLTLEFAPSIASARDRLDFFLRPSR